MKITVKQALQQGVAAHKRGKLEEAERLYRAILQSQPLHPDANHNLGVLAASANKVGAALLLFKTALEANPKIEQFWLSYIDALIKEKQFDNAKQVLDQAKRQGVAREKLNVLETQLPLTAQVNEPKSSAHKKSLEFSEKRKKLTEQKKQKKAKKIKATSPSEVEVNNLLHQFQTARYGDAEKLALSLTERFPHHNFSWKVLAEIFKKVGRTPKALVAGQKAVEIDSQDPAAHFNLGITLQELGRLDEAEASYTQAIALRPGYAEAHGNLGVTLKELGRLNEADVCYEQAIKLKPDYAEAHSNLGVTLQELGRLEEAEISLRRAIALKPDHAEAHGNLGVTLQELGRLEEAKISYTQAIVLQPDYAEAYSNLGNTLQELGRLEEAEVSLRQAIALKPDLAEVHNNLGNALKELGRLEEAEASYMHAIALQPDYARVHNNLGATLLELGRLEEATNIYHLMLTTKSECVSNVTASPVIALLPFGRAGSMFFHSLFDGHPEVATLPGVYFKGWFGIDQWRRFAPDLGKLDWREHLIAKIVKEYQPFFNASCKNNVAGKPFGNSQWLAKDLGFTNMGPDQSQTFFVDQKSFSDTFLFLLKPFSSIGIQECFELIHRAFEISARGNACTNSQKSSNIFYHIHNPDPYEHAHFLKHYPQARLLNIIRNPIQSMESWMLSERSGHIESADENTKTVRGHVQLIYRWIKMVNVVATMFMQLQSPFNSQAHSRGVRLEDVKRNAHDVMPKIAAWIGIPDHPAIYESSFCGFQYWGPSSKETGKITGFDTKAIDLPAGRLLGSRDILIFETLFWPLSYQYGYTQLETAEFRCQLMEIRSWLDEPLEFEKQLYDELFDQSCALEKLTPYIRLHDLLSRLWETLYRDGTYRNMVKPLELAD